MLTDYQNSYFSYVRVSSREQSEGASLDEQDRQNEDYAKRRDMPIVKTFREVESAAENNRPTFKLMVQELRHYKVKGIIFNKIDRAARNLKDQALLEDLAKEGFELHFVADGISTESPNWRLVFVQFGFAKFYIENLKQEIEKGTMGMLHDGRSPNPAPIGYKDMGRGVKDVDPVQAKFIKKAYELYASGNYAITEITAILKNEGLRNKFGRPVNDKVLYKLLRKPFYYGIVTYRGVAYNGAHPAIITKQLYDKVQAMLDGKNFKHVHRFYYVFQSLIPCPECGRRMRSVSAKGRYKYYNCRDSQCENTKNLNEKEVEELFFKSLQRLEFNNEEVELFLNAVKQFRVDLRSHKRTDLRHIDMEGNYKA